jgi:hypothetical protein
MVSASCLYPGITVVGTGSSWAIDWLLEKNELFEASVNDVMGIPLCIIENKPEKGEWE